MDQRWDQSIRGEEQPKNFSDHLTLITIGGSTTECNFISDGKTWTDILGTLLKNDFDNVWINNAGLDGHSTFGHIVLMKGHIVNLRPKVVIFLIGANDHALENISKQDLANIRTGLNFHSLKGFLKSTANYSEVASLALNLHRYLRAVKLKFTNHEVDFDKALREMSPVDDEIFLKEKKEHKQKYLPGYELRIRHLIALSKENGINPVFVTQPSLYGDFIDEVTGLNFEKSNYSWQILELYNNVLRSCCQSQEIFFLDMANELPKNSGYFYDWFHYTNEGSKRFAEILYSKLSLYLAKQFPQFKKDYYGNRLQHNITY